MQEQLIKVARVGGAAVQLVWVLPTLVVCFVGVPAVSVGLVASGRPASIVLGGLVGALWLFLVAVAIRKRTPQTKRRAPAPPPSGPAPN